MKSPSDESLNQIIFSGSGRRKQRADEELFKNPVLRRYCSIVTRAWERNSGIPLHIVIADAIISWLDAIELEEKRAKKKPEEENKVGSGIKIVGEGEA